MSTFLWMWGAAKWDNKKRRGTDRNCLDSYLTEFMWRSKLNNRDLFETILKDIAEFWESHKAVVLAEFWNDVGTSGLVVLYSNSDVAGQLLATAQVHDATTLP
ncbi:DDE Tnp IS1595 domain-containing protein [Aphis craccivora]|uniref:DDE Tnp IS1595 domain-containing protein n=1 Tax=Aphis craccivora TaxID=307492 RepID=A0A6G0ZGB9_APHCR|nr:DDE Tnp IS1595 domain-containing protein [Aphis craccivora]